MCAFLIKLFVFRWGMFCSEAVCCSHSFYMSPLTVGDNKKTELTLPWAIHLLFCPAQHLQTLFPEQSPLPCVAVNQGGFLCWLQTELFSLRCPRQALLPGRPVLLGPHFLCIWLFSLFGIITLPHHVLVINYFPHLPKFVPIACNQLNEHHSTYIITHACDFPSTASRHLHTCGFPSQSVHFLLKHVHLISYSHYKQLHNAYYFCTYHFFHILGSLFWKIPRSEVTEAKVTDIIIALERYCQDAF